MVDFDIRERSDSRIEDGDVVYLNKGTDARIIFF